MGRIVYLAFPTGAVAGGQKMILRHVETLRDLGFEAVLWRRAAGAMPQWLSYRGPVEVETPFLPDDILVIPSDAPNAIAAAAGMPQRTLIFCQNQFSFAAQGFEAVDHFSPARFPIFLAPGRITAAAIGRLYPKAEVEVIPCFADERVFGPASKAHRIVCAPRKRPDEARAIRHLFRRLHPRHAALPWLELDGVSEAEVARAFAAASLFLSLSRFEAVGMTPLEAMAAACAPGLPASAGSNTPRRPTASGSRRTIWKPPPTRWPAPLTWRSPAARRSPGAWTPPARPLTDGPSPPSAWRSRRSGRGSLRRRGAASRPPGDPPATGGSGAGSDNNGKLRRVEGN